MKFICTVKKNKKGRDYNTRNNSTANGIMKCLGNHHVPEKILMLAVYGTFDVLAKQKFDRIWITVQHPIDKDYTKKVMILKKNRREFISRMPIEDRNKIVYKQKL